MIESWPRTPRPDAQATDGDAFERMDTAPLELSALHGAIRSRADLLPEAAQEPPKRRRRRWVVVLGTVLLVGIAVVAVVLLVPRGAGRSQAQADTGTANTTSPGTAGRSVPDTGWQPLELTGAWFATGDGARFRVRDGVCYLQVHVSVPAGTWPGNTEIGTLPPSAAPAWNLGFSAVRAGQPFGEVKVFSSGRILVVAPSNAPGGDITVSGSFPVG